jgi:hypothetical protein
MHQHALAFAHTNRIVESEKAAVDRRVFVPHHLEAVITAGDESVPVVQREKEFLIELPGIARCVDHEKTELPGVRGAVEVLAGEQVRVIPARARRIGREGVAPAAACGNRGRSFFHCAIDIGGNGETVPVNELFGIRVVHHVDRDGRALLQPEDWPRDSPVVRDGAHDPAGREFERERGDAQCVIGSGTAHVVARCGGCDSRTRRRIQLCDLRQPGRECSGAARREKMPSIH